MVASATDLVRVEDGFVRGMPPGQKITTAYMKLHNLGDKKLQLLGGKTQIASTVEIHSHEQRDGMMRMRKLDFLSLPGHQTITLEPSGNHLMLLGLKRMLKDGEKINITLQFEGGEEQTIQLPVRSVLSENQHQHHH